ncbi:MAG TPA: hypothetical protein VFN64_04855 [Burkholderiaceae bacterium]|nr:hypothetical protein [Burkholderiaceae bacterium]
MSAARRGSREAAVLEAARAAMMIERKLRELGRLVTSIKFWQRRAAYYQARATMTNEQLAALRHRARRVPRRRAIRVRRNE